MSRRQSSATKRSINYRASREKSTQPTTNTRSSMKTIIFALKHRWTVKQLIACSTEQLLVVNNSPILLGAPGEKTSSGHPSPRPLGNYLLLDTLPLLISVFLRACVCVCVWGGGGRGGGRIFSGSTQWGMKSVSKLLIQVSSSFVWKCPYIYSAHIQYGHLGDRGKVAVMGR